MMAVAPPAVADAVWACGGGAAGADSCVVAAACAADCGGRVVGRTAGAFIEPGGTVTCFGEPTAGVLVLTSNLPWTPRS